MSKEFYFLLATATAPRFGNLEALPLVGMTFTRAVNSRNGNRAMAGAGETHGIPAHYNSIFPDALLAHGMRLPVLDIVLSC